MQHFMWLTKVVSLLPSHIDLHLVCKDVSWFPVIHTETNSNVSYSSVPVGAVCYIFPALLALGIVMSGKGHVTSPGH